MWQTRRFFLDLYRSIAAHILAEKMCFRCFWLSRKAAVSVSKPAVKWKNSTSEASPKDDNILVKATLQLLCSARTENGQRFDLTSNRLKGDSCKILQTLHTTFKIVDFKLPGIWVRSLDHR